VRVALRVCEGGASVASLESVTSLVYRVFEYQHIIIIIIISIMLIISGYEFLLHRKVY
jgi:hypothetical protein